MNGYFVFIAPIWNLKSTLRLEEIKMFKILNKRLLWGKTNFFFAVLWFTNNFKQYIIKCKFQWLKLQGKKAKKSKSERVRTRLEVIYYWTFRIHNVQFWSFVFEVDLNVPYFVLAPHKDFHEQVVHLFRYL